MAGPYTKQARQPTMHLLHITKPVALHLRRLAAFILLSGMALLGLWGVLSINRCNPAPPALPALTQTLRSDGPLEIGAARVPIAFDFPLTVGGYGPWRSTAHDAAAPFYARALVFRQRGLTLALVSLETLLIPDELSSHIAARFSFPVWTIATHTHSGPGGIDARLPVQLAALGRYRSDVADALVNGAQKAIQHALEHFHAVELSARTFSLDGFSVPRTGEKADERVSQVGFWSGETLVAQIIVASAHPALEDMRTTHLHPDWPGLLSSTFEENNGPVTVVFQGAAGNASVNRDAYASSKTAAQKLMLALQTPSETPRQSAPLSMGWATARVPLPHPDAQRLMPSGLQAAAENVLCDEASQEAYIHGLQLGQTRFLWAPFEFSLPAGLAMEEAADVDRLVSLSDGYLGYIETEDAVRTAQGESPKQYFPAETLLQLTRGARLVGEALR